MNIEILFFLSETIMIISYMMSKMIALRTLVCVASIGYLIAAYISGFNSPGMLATFFFSLLALLINLLHIYRLFYAKIPTNIPNKYKTAYQRHFTPLTKREFLILLDYSEKSLVKNNFIIYENKRANICLTLSGTVEVLLNGNQVAKLPPCSLVGEISFLTNDKSIASIKAIDEVEICCWKRKNLQKLEKKYPEIFYKFYEILLKEVSLKLTRQNKKFIEQ